MSDFVLSAKQKEDAHSAFKLFEKKGQEKISTKELGNVFKSCALAANADKMEEWVDAVDPDGTGSLTFDQFLEIFTRKKKEDEDEKELKEAFRVLDKNNRGVIDVDDLRWILRQLGDDITEEEIDDMITMTDTDASGTVDYEEFSNLMMGE